MYLSRVSQTNTLDSESGAKAEQTPIALDSHLGPDIANILTGNDTPMPAMPVLQQKKAEEKADEHTKFLEEEIVKANEQLKQLLDNEQTSAGKMKADPSNGKGSWKHQEMDKPAADEHKVTQTKSESVDQGKAVSGDLDSGSADGDLVSDDVLEEYNKAKKFHKAPRSDPKLAKGGDQMEADELLSDREKIMHMEDEFADKKVEAADQKLDDEAEVHEDFLDLQSEARDTQLTQIEAARDKARIVEFGCLNGGMQCDDASSEPEDPFDAPSTESIGVRDSGAIDLASVLHSAEQRASTIVNELESQKAEQLSSRETARREYASGRKANERDFQDKLRQLNQQHAQNKKAARAKAKKAVLDARKSNARAWKVSQVRSIARDTMVADRMHMRDDRQSAKRQLRAERRAQQEMLEKVYKDAMGTYSRFNRRLMKARFTRNILPKIRTMMAADVQGNLTLLDLSCGEPEKAVSQVVKDKGFKGITDIPAMRFYITERARQQVMPSVDEHFKKIRGELWHKLGRVKEQTKTSLVSTVGAVPHVGQTLSGVIPDRVDDVYGAIQHAVNTSLNHVRQNIATKLMESVANPVMDVLSPKLRSGEKLDFVTLPLPVDLAVMAKQSRKLETQSVQANWEVGLQQAIEDAARQNGEIVKDAQDEAKLALAEKREDNDMLIQVLDTQ
jgi:hypothetical protein